ncbi:hypothetical protein BED47_16835 [Gottfriedia luciferensis]|uniref:Glycosyl transferase family 1 domain-containing protein n=1 Tax=Gottfriedia luciferensis TaxID=178774 RepID=A0ABX3A1H3_9BACI|nr:glycosyltransferase [Gottfriedia luciferensis]ODG93168.1 hypothetical protein BED47_16835 [Gottfriedia luciferensis]
MRKILFVIPSLGGGGAERILVDLLNKIVSLDTENRYSISVFSITGGVLESQLSEKIKIIKILKNSSFTSWKFKAIKIFLRLISPKMLRNILRLKIKEKYDTEVAFLEGFPIKYISKSLSEKIGWIHTDLDNYNYCKNYFLNKKQETRIYSEIDRLAFVSSNSKAGYIKYFNLEKNSELKDKLFTLENPIDIDRVENLAKRDCDITDKFICSVGRLSHEKGYDRLIDAFSKINSENLKLVIVGSGPLKTKILELIKEKKLEEKIIIIPFTDNPYIYIANAEFFISSSRVEGYPTVVTEALILKKPVVSTRTGAASILKEGKYGLLVDNSTEGIYSGIKRMVYEKEDYLLKSLDIYINVKNENKQKLDKILSFLNL